MKAFPICLLIHLLCYLRNVESASTSRTPICRLRTSVGFLARSDPSHSARRFLRSENTVFYRGEGLSILGAAETLESSPFEELRKHVHNALPLVYRKTAEPYKLVIHKLRDKGGWREGHYQTHVAKKIAYQIQKPLLQIAAQICENINQNGNFHASFTSSGQIIVKQDVDWAAGEVLRILGGKTDFLGRHPQRVVIDFAGANIGKPLHFGHLRSCVIGDVLGRAFESTGAEVFRQSHWGDWGLPMGALLAEIKEVKVSSITPDLLAKAYRSAHAKLLSDHSFAEMARAHLRRLQEGEPSIRGRWLQTCKVALQENKRLLHQLGLKPVQDRAESYYAEFLEETIGQIKKEVKTFGDEASIWVELPDKEPLMLRRSDRTYTYAGIDLAAIFYRVQKLRADKILYVVDEAQAPHFSKVFAVARAANLAPPDVQLEHIKFGLVFGSQGGRLRSRESEDMKLGDILEGAVNRAGQQIENRSHTTHIPSHEAHQASLHLGVDAVKYGDLRMKRESSYKLNLCDFFGPLGNTSSYISYTFARLKAIVRKASEAQLSNPSLLNTGGFAVEGEDERRFCFLISEFGGTLDRMLSSRQPHILSHYLFDLCKRANSFYEKCLIISPPKNGPNTKDNIIPHITPPHNNLRPQVRLALISVALKVIDMSASLLGLQPLSRM